MSFTLIVSLQELLHRYAKLIDGATRSPSPSGATTPTGDNCPLPPVDPSTVSSDQPAYQTPPISNTVGPQLAWVSTDMRYDPMYMLSMS
jgi:hypothetical protein